MLQSGALEITMKVCKCEKFSLRIFKNYENGHHCKFTNLKNFARQAHIGRLHCLQFPFVYISPTQGFKRFEC